MLSVETKLFITFLLCKFLFVIALYLWSSVSYYSLWFFLWVVSNYCVLIYYQPHQPVLTLYSDEPLTAARWSPLRPVLLAAATTGGQVGDGHHWRTGGWCPPLADRWAMLADRWVMATTGGQVGDGHHWRTGGWWPPLADRWVMATSGGQVGDCHHWRTGGWWPPLADRPVMVTPDPWMAASLHCIVLCLIFVQLTNYYRQIYDVIRTSKLLFIFLNSSFFWTVGAVHRPSREYNDGDFFSPNLWYRALVSTTPDNPW